MIKFFKDFPCALPLAFMLVYGILILSIVPYFSPSLLYVSRIIGLVAFVSVFTLVMIDAFRPFFNVYYKASKLTKIYKVLWVITLILALVHSLIIYFTLGFDVITGNVIGLVAMIAMIFTVILNSLRLTKYPKSLLVSIHVVSYLLFPLLYVHELMLGLAVDNYVSLTIINGCLVFVLYGLFYRLKIIFSKA